MERVPQNTLLTHTGLAGKHCANCGASVPDTYCSTCGQRYIGERLTFRRVARDAATNVFQLDRGLLRTFVEMFTRPGELILRYIGGQRKRYVNPVTYLFLGTALSLIAFSFLREESAAWMREMTNSSPENPLLTPEQNDRLVELNLKATLYTAYLMLLMSVPFASLLRLFNRKSGRNTAENFIFALYTFGHVAFVDALLTPFMLVVTDNVSIHIAVSFVLYLVVCGYAAYGFFNRRLFSVVKTEIALVLAYAALSIGLGMVLMLYVSAG